MNNTTSFKVLNAFLELGINQGGHAYDDTGCDEASVEVDGIGSVTVTFSSKEISFYLDEGDEEPSHFEWTGTHWLLS
jgi:hypothetical protein